MVAVMLDVDTFIARGFVKVAATTPRDVADAARQRLWDQIALSPDAPDAWRTPVVWTSDLTGAGPFGDLVRSPVLANALDAVCGEGRWQPRGSLGNIPVRFPVTPSADDRGWHVDANTPQPDGSWTVTGRPHTLLVLTLLSDVGPEDAPTRIRVGSHHDVARVLGTDALALEEMGRVVDEASGHRPIAHATGAPGDVYLVHPFTVHAADEHRGTVPRFMAQSPVLLTEPLAPGSPVPLGRVFGG
jgi:hypothetical protein